MVGATALVTSVAALMLLHAASSSSPPTGRPLVAIPTTPFSKPAAPAFIGTTERVTESDGGAVVAPTNRALRSAAAAVADPDLPGPTDGGGGGGGGVPPIKAVILFLYGGRWHSYFTRECLPRLDAYLLRCFPYPLHVFHEGASDAQRAGIAAAVPHAPRVDFEDVGWVWKALPAGVTEAKVAKWMTEGVQPKFQGRGYRVMCRFWAGVAWSLPSMKAYDYYWRLDTDSVLTRPVLVDPFRHVFVERGCDYGFNRLKGENPHVATGLWETFEAWAAAALRDGVVTSDAVERVRRLALHPPPGSSTVPKTPNFWAPMYYNNFEMGSFALKRSAAYTSFFEFADSHEPFGIFRYRWGDAPVHTLGVIVALPDEKRCNVSHATVGYKHAGKARNLDPIVPAGQLPVCPATASADRK